MRLILRTIYALFLALDLLLSAVTFGAPLQTMSARFAIWRASGNPVGKFLANATDFVALKVFGAENHCKASRIAYLARLAAAPSWSG